MKQWINDAWSSTKARCASFFRKKWGWLSIIVAIALIVFLIIEYVSKRGAKKETAVIQKKDTVPRDKVIGSLPSSSKSKDSPKTDPVVVTKNKTDSLQRLVDALRKTKTSNTAPATTVTKAEIDIDSAAIAQIAEKVVKKLQVRQRRTPSKNRRCPRTRRTWYGPPTPW